MNKLEVLAKIIDYYFNTIHFILHINRSYSQNYRIHKIISYFSVNLLTIIIFIFLHYIL